MSESIIHGKYPIELTQEIVRQLLDYNPDTGALTWRERDRWWFKTDRNYGFHENHGAEKKENA